MEKGLNRLESTVAALESTVAAFG